MPSSQTFKGGPGLTHKHWRLNQLNQRPKPVTGRLVVVFTKWIVSKLYFAVHFLCISVFQDKDQNLQSPWKVWNNLENPGGPANSATGGQRVSLPIITIVTPVTRPLHTILQALHPRRRAFSLYWMGSPPPFLSQTEQTKPGFAHVRQGGGWGTPELGFTNSGDTPRTPHLTALHLRQARAGCFEILCLVNRRRTARS